MDVDINMGRTLPSKSVKRGRALVEMLRRHPDNISEGRAKGGITLEGSGKTSLRK